MKKAWILQYNIEKLFYSKIIWGYLSNRSFNYYFKPCLKDVSLIHWFNILLVGGFGVFGIITRYPFATACDWMGRCKHFVGSEIYSFMIFISVIYTLYIFSSVKK